VHLACQTQQWSHRTPWKSLKAFESYFKFPESHWKYLGALFCVSNCKSPCKAPCILSCKKLFLISLHPLLFFAFVFIFVWCSDNAIKISYLYSVFVLLFVYLCKCMNICHCICHFHMKPGAVLFPMIYVTMLGSWKHCLFYWWSV